MMRKYGIFPTLLAGLVVLLVSCGPYVLVSGKQSLPEYGFEVVVPEGWYRFAHTFYAGPSGALDTAQILEGIVLTRDGLLLQQIRVGRAAVDKNPNFTTRKFDLKLPPQELADIELDDHRSNPNVFNLVVEENVPAMVEGRRGFKLVYTWTTEDGYRLKRIHYGFMEGKWVYRIIYQAAARHYFDRDLATFEKLRESFNLVAMVGDPQRERSASHASSAPTIPRPAPVVPPSGGQGPAGTSVTSRPSASSFERPKYAVGQKWIRNDGEYTLDRVERNIYIFAADRAREVHMTRDLVLARVKSGAFDTGIDPPIELRWPLRVGSWGQGQATWNVPLDPTRLRVTYTWAVEAFEKVSLPVGTFRAFRIVLEWQPAVLDVVTMSNFPKKRLVLWYAPEIQQLVKGEYSDPGPLNFHIVALDTTPLPAPRQPTGTALPTPPKTP
jgi:hypothetical protein